MSQDRLYAQPMDTIGDFVFDERVAQVFPDMIARSVPGYGALLDGIGTIAEALAPPRRTVYDLGCSLGAVSAMLRRRLADRPFSFIGVDNSKAMIDRCRLCLLSQPLASPWQLICADIRDVRVKAAGLVVLNLTLQFLPLVDRAGLLRQIHAGLCGGGVLILSEKIHFEECGGDALMTELHHAYKRSHGYSNLEISQKRSALEQVLLPETPAMHYDRLREAGFSRVETWFQAFNFISILAIK